MKRLLATLALTAAIFWSADAAASNPACPNAQVLSGSLITDTCWDCIFPITLASIPIGGDSPQDSRNLPAEQPAGQSANTPTANQVSGAIASSGPPSGAASNPVCICNGSDGIPQPGVSLGMWVPAQIVELVRWPGCMASLDGTDLGLNDRLVGTPGPMQRANTDAMSFYNYHTYAFPLLVMLQLFVSSDCIADGYMDMDVMFTSELDPTWNNSTLSFFQQPEAALVANPVSMAACALDATAATIGAPLDDMFWCAGNWGDLYPFTGFGSTANGMPWNTSLLMARALAVQHRRALAWRTMGSDAQCGAVIDPMFVKSQYKASMFFPVAEADSSHLIGLPTMFWGDWRAIPATGEDAVYMIFRWQDCCLR
jgi:conjugal transfer pilus assembly protein TraU